MASSAIVERRCGFHNRVIARPETPMQAIAAPLPQPDLIQRKQPAGVPALS